MSFVKWFIRSNYAQLRFRSENFFSLNRAINFLATLYELGNGEYVLYIRLYFSRTNFPFSFVSGKYAICHRALAPSCTRWDRYDYDNSGSRRFVSVAMSVVKYRRCCKNCITNIKWFQSAELIIFFDYVTARIASLQLFIKFNFDPKYSNFGFTQNCGNLQG